MTALIFILGGVAVGLTIIWETRDERAKRRTSRVMKGPLRAPAK